MADETTETATSEVEAPAQETIDWKAKAREWEARSKANHKRVGELETQVEQLTRERDEATQARETLTSEREALAGERDALALRLDAFEVAEATGVAASLLKGSNRSELEAHAKELKAWKRQTVKGAAPNVGYQPEDTPNSQAREFLRELLKKEG